MYTQRVNTHRNQLNQLSIVILLLSSSLMVLIAHATQISITRNGKSSEIAETNTTANVENAISEIFNKESTIYDDIDVYVPYRSDAHDQFSWTFLKQILDDETNNNVVVSPFSVQLVLALLAEAAGPETETKRQLTSTLTDIKSPDNLLGYYKKTLMALKLKSPHYTLNLETKLYADTSIQPQQRYQVTLHKSYDTDIETLDFSQPGETADLINAWCQNVTHGRLTQIVTKDNIKDKVLLLANVIYFNGLWRNQFNDTFEGVFFHTPTKQLKVNYMKQTEYFYYHNSTELDARILRLPYKGKKFSMFIVLPKSKGGLDALLKTLDNRKLKSMQFMMEEVKAIVTLPKFSFEYNKDLKGVLNQLGIKDVFTDSASLPGLARGVDKSNPLKVSNIFQKAGIDVNEKGTEVYASTVVEIENKFGGSTTIEEFTVDQPFLFFIEEESSGNLIFAGKVHDP